MPITLNGTTGIVSPSVVGGLVSGTAVASTSGTSIDFTGIPSWVKRITVMFSGVSTSGTSYKLIQLGDSGGVETTGYFSLSSYVTTASAADAEQSTAGFILNSNAAVDILYGAIVFTLISGTNWVAQGSFAIDGGTDSVVNTSGAKSLSDTLTQIRITTVNGTDTFDAGTINIIYEG
jgi:hypothetical protein